MVCRRGGFIIQCHNELRDLEADMLSRRCRRGGFIIQCHNELRDLEADMLSMVCNNFEIERVLQELTGESLPSGANRAPEARPHIHARGF